MGRQLPRRLHEAFAEGRLFEPDSPQFTYPPTNEGTSGAERAVSFFDTAVEYVERKWRGWEPASRRNARRDIASACLLLVTDDAPTLSTDELTPPTAGCGTCARSHDPAVPGPNRKRWR